MGITEDMTGEDYTVVKTSSDRCQTPVSEGRGGTLSPIQGPPPHPRIHENINDQKILELTNKMLELLTGEVPIMCQDVTVYFSMEEWEYLEGHKERYKEVMMEEPQPRTSPGLSSTRTTPERCPAPPPPPQDPQMNKDKDQIMEKILNLSLEIIFHLTGEDYTLVKTSSDHCQAPVCEGRGGTLRPIPGPPPHPRIHEDINDQKILELTNKMLELLTGEVPIRCQDVTVYFSMEEWEYLEGHKERYKEVMMEEPQPRTSPGLSSTRTTPERCPAPPPPPQDPQLLDPDKDLSNINSLERNVSGDQRSNEGIPTDHRPVATRSNMNFRARDTTWLSLLDDVMKSDGDFAGGATGTHSDDSLINKYKDLSKKRMKLWWNRAFLTKYLERDMVPRGLRIKVFPSFAIEDEEFRSKWETLAQTCSKGFLTLLCDHNSSSLTLIESELETLDKTITEKCDVTVITRFNLEMEKELEKWEKEIKMYKIKKFNRDLLDYSTQKAYRWKIDNALKDVNLFARKLILKKLFHKKDTVTDSQAEREAIQNLEELLQEQEAPPTVDIFVRLVSEDFRKIDTRRKWDNLTHSQRKALTELQSYPDIVIKPADKGGNIVVMSSDKYEHEVARQLRDKGTYVKLPSNPLGKYTSELAVILERALEIGLIDKKMHDGLCRKYPKIPTFYVLPKIHKDAVNPPGRPIVSGIEGMCDPICKFIDYYLQPMVETLPSYVRDTTDVLRRIDGIFLDDDMTIVTADVEGLYTCIAHEDGLRAVRFFLEMSGRDDEMGELILELLRFVLTHNFFGPAEQLDQFMGQLNRNKFNIKLTYKCSTRKIDFLDVEISVDDRGSIQTDVFRKKTSVNALLHASSAHNPSTIRAIPTGQFLRMRRICSSDSKFEIQSSDLRARFSDRGYSNRNIKFGYNRAKKTPRAQLLAHVPKKQDSFDPSVRFIGTYNEKWDTMRDIMRKHWPVLLTDPVLAQNLTDRPLMTSRRAKNLKDFLLEVHLKTHIEEKSFSCSECGKCFSWKSELNVHMKIHTGEKLFSCSECRKCFILKSTLDFHIKSHTGEKPFSCSECWKCFIVKSQLNRHMKTHTEEKPFSCSECGKCFIQKSSLDFHMKSHTGEKPFSCSECGKCFILKSQLNQHMKTHTGEKPFSCSECGKCFIQKSSLDCHMKSHTREKPFSCSECGKCFIQKSSLDCHMKSHTGEKPFLCSECGKCFIRKYHLNVHLKSHTGEKLFSCSECGKCFIRKSHLDRHINTHTGEKPFSCSECGKCFIVKSQLDRHIKTHTGEKLFSCSECGKCLIGKKHLDQHRKSHTGEKLFSCSECGKCYRWKSQLYDHIKTHTGEKPFLCSDCGKCFIRKSQLNVHLKSHTGEAIFVFRMWGMFYSESTA
ncbi:uncharacterized protein LOC142279151 [Anomaloglossus baeobatrachus]|uniref:uncharacterized protein LOC142279151 n=1 Tax=Anomaloglossus baeobatrachus TaxID=238106 RepID=UPI003F506270